MPSTLSTLATYNQPEYATSEAVRNKLKIAKHYIKKHPDTTMIVVDINKAYMHVGDLFGYLSTIEIEPYLHWAILLISDLESPTHFGPETKVLYIPSVDVIQSFELTE